MRVTKSPNWKRCCSTGLFIIVACSIMMGAYIIFGRVIPNGNSIIPKQWDVSNLLYEKVTYIPYRTDMQSLCNYDYPKLDLFEEKVPNYIKKYRNPCWRENGELLCIPYVFLVGVQKCGTTDLFMRLTQHPDFVAPIKKQLGWFARRQMFKEPNATQLKYYASNYFAQLPKQLERSGNTQLITGEGSVNSFVGSKTWKYIIQNENLDEPKVNIPEYIYHINKEAKILINVRNPVDRLWSEYLAFTKDEKRSPQIFHNHVTELIRQYNDCLLTRSLRACMYDFSLAQYATMSLDEQVLYKYNCYPKKGINKIEIRRGVYHVFIKDFLKVFPKEQVLVQRLEDTARDLTATVKRTYKFLGLDIPDKKLKEILKPDIKNSRASKNRPDVGVMFNSTRQMLYKFYKPHNMELSRLLKDDAFNYGPQG